MSHTSSPASRQGAPCGRQVIGRIDQQSARKGTDRAFGHTHVLIGNKVDDPELLQDRLGETDDHGIVAAQHLTHGTSPLLPLQLLEPRALLSRTVGLTAGGVHRLYLAANQP